MISRYLAYNQPEFQKEVFAAGGQTMIVFSRLQEIVALDGEQIRKLSLIFDLLQEKAEEEEPANEEKEMLYGTLVDAFEEENYFVNHREEKITARNLKVMELAVMPTEEESPFGETYSNETLIAFGYLNSKDLYVTPEELHFLIDDFNWFVQESGRCKPETATFLQGVIAKMEQECQMIEEGKPHVNLFVCGL